MTPLPYNRNYQRCYGDDEENQDKFTFEPVVYLAAIEDNLETRKSDRDEHDSQAVDFQLATLPRRFHLVRKLRRVRDKATRENH